MLTQFFQRRQQHYALHKFGRSVLGAALQVHTHKYFYETVLRGLSPEVKQNIIKHFSNRVIAIDKAPNPLLAFRKELCNAAISYTDLQVLCLTPDEKSERFGEMRYISGELHRFMRQCADFNKEIAEIIRVYPQCNDDELSAFAKGKCAVLLYYLDGWNVVRAKMEPPAENADKDWFRPFIRSMLIFSEDAARQKLGLSRLCADSIVALRHGSFMTDVARGKANPLFEWEQFFGRKHVEDS